MIDPYRTPRIQRQVPERGDTAAGIAILAEDARRRMLETARALSRRVIGEVWRHLTAAELTQDALISGAMPGEFDASELRAEDPITIVTSGDKHFVVYPQNVARIQPTESVSVPITPTNPDLQCCACGGVGHRSSKCPLYGRSR